MNQDAVYIGQWRWDADKKTLAYVARKGEHMFQVLCYHQAVQIAEYWYNAFELQRIYPQPISLEQIALAIGCCDKLR